MEEVCCAAIKLSSSLLVFGSIFLSPGPPPKFPLFLSFHVLAPYKYVLDLHIFHVPSDRRFYQFVLPGHDIISLFLKATRSISPLVVFLFHPFNGGIFFFSYSQFLVDWNVDASDYRMSCYRVGGKLLLLLYYTLHGGGKSSEYIYESAPVVGNGAEQNRL